MTNAQWIVLLNPDVPWKQSYPQIRDHVASYLDAGVAKGAELSTTQLVEHIYPERLARGDGITARKRLFKVLMALATHGLEDYCHRGEPVKGKLGKLQRPYVWHARRAETVCCPHCGGAL